MNPSIAVIFALLIGVGPDDDLAALLDGAIASYEAAKEETEHTERLARFREAMLAFDRVARAGVENAELQTNLGNAALQAQEIGRAVLAYRRALFLDPDHARAATNLSHIRRQLPAWVPRPQEESILDTFFFWHRSFSLRERLLAAAVSFALAALLVALALRLRLTWPRNAAVLPALAWVALLASAFLEPGATSDQAVITSSDVIARSADSPRARPRFAEPLPGGTEVRILEERAGWTHIQLANGREAWIDRGSLTRILIPTT